MAQASSVSLPQQGQYSSKGKVLLLGAGLAVVVGAAGAAAILVSVALAKTVEQKVPVDPVDKSDRETVVGCLAGVVLMVAVAIVAAVIMMVKGRHQIRYHVAKFIHTPQQWKTARYAHTRGMPKAQRQSLPPRPA